MHMHLAFVKPTFFLESYHGQHGYASHVIMVTMSVNGKEQTFTPYKIYQLTKKLSQVIISANPNICAKFCANSSTVAYVQMGKI